MSNDSTIRIVVGVDFTEIGDHALDEALRYARKLDGSELHPVFVIAEPPKDKIAELDQALQQARDALRERVLQRGEAIGQRFDLPCVLHVRVGEPAEAIHQVVVDMDGDVIVVGTHGRKGLSKMLLGSVAEELIRTARVPVMVARPKQIDDLEKSAWPEDARPGEDLHQQRVMASEALRIGKRPSHIAGLV